MPDHRAACIVTAPGPSADEVGPAARGGTPAFDRRSAPRPAARPGRAPRRSGTRDVFRAADQQALRRRRRRAGAAHVRPRSVAARRRPARDRRPARRRPRAAGGSPTARCVIVDDGGGAARGAGAGAPWPACWRWRASRRWAAVPGRCRDAAAAGRADGRADVEPCQRVRRRGRRGPACRRHRAGDGAARSHGRARHRARPAAPSRRRVRDRARAVRRPGAGVACERGRRPPQPAQPHRRGAGRAGRRDGVVGLCAVPAFMGDGDPHARLAEHHAHIVARAGAGAVAFGADFCDYFDDDLDGPKATAPAPARATMCA